MAPSGTSGIVQLITSGCVVVQPSKTLKLGMESFLSVGREERLSER